MKTRSYNRELTIATGLVLDVFNNIVIDRRVYQNKKYTTQKNFSVPCVFGNRSSILKKEENRRGVIKNPIITVSSIGDVVRDDDRVHSINNDVLFQVDGASNFVIDKLMPIPINLTFEIGAAARYIEDIDQIICNFIPFFNPQIFVAWNHPKYTDINITSPLLWNNDMSRDLPLELSQSEQYKCFFTTTFTLKTWFFAGLDEDNSDAPLIHKINVTPNLIPYGEDGYMLDRWYDVPNTIGFELFRENLKAGYITKDRERPNWDWLPISGTSGDTFLSGYWQSITGAVSGTSLAQSLSADGYNLVHTDEELLFFSCANLLTEGMKEFDFRYWYENEVTDKSKGHNEV